MVADGARSGLENKSVYRKHHSSQKNNREGDGIVPVVEVVISPHCSALYVRYCAVRTVRCVITDGQTEDKGATFSILQIVCLSIGIILLVLIRRQSINHSQYLIAQLVNISFL
jgi:hypothetical protein